jgi:alpha-L-rhamnosidase
VPADRVAGVAKFVKSRKMGCSVYGAQYLMDALYLAGEDDYALSLMQSKEKRSWWNMIREGSTISMEAWGNQFKSNQDWNHAWGAVPANIIPRRLMGVTPLEPGFGRIQIKPRVGSLTSGSLKTPTIRGPVYVAFKQEPGKSFTLTVKIPANTTADVYLPIRGGRDTVLMDGKQVKGKVDGKFLLVPGVGSGEHRFVTSAR